MDAMRRAASVVAGTFTFVSLLVACSSFMGEDAPSPSSPSSPAEAGTSAGDAATPPGDAGADGCVLLVHDDFSDEDASRARWRLLGTARIADGEAELTPDDGGANGAMWLNLDEARSGVLRATFTAKIAIAEGANGADGLAFAWAANRDVPLGGGGGFYGVCGNVADGLAVVMSSLSKEVRLYDVNGGCAEQGGEAASVYGTNDLQVTVASDRVHVTVSDRPYEFASPRAVNVRSLGFSAATGLWHARHAIDDVRVEVCPP